MKVKLLAASLAALLFLGGNAEAQFYTQGSDPGSVRWSQVRTQNYRIVYPRGLDSLARVYATNLENVRMAVGEGTGMAPNCNYRRPMPVILHPFTTDANGMVTWTPRRMELQTTPDANSFDATPWPMQLAVHESRHVSQMQLGSSRTFKWLKYPLGQLVDGALAAVYGGPVFFEGDAVLAETAITQAGRGRSAEFLEYYRASFGHEKPRDYWQWLYGSQKHFTPNHYALGYLTLAGASSLYGTNISGNFYDKIRTSHGISFWNLERTIKDASGKSFRESFQDITGHFREEWDDDEKARAPFQSAEMVSTPGRKYHKYEGLVTWGDHLYAVKSGMDTPSTLVRIDENGKEDREAPFYPGITDLQYDPVMDRIYWTEYSPDPRWELRSWSDVRYLGADGKIRTLTHRHRYYNVCSSDEGLLSVTEYYDDGTSAAVVLDPEGRVLRVIKAPDGFQLLETIWIDDILYSSALTENGGVGIFCLEDFRPLLAPQRASVTDLQAFGENIAFGSDLNGVSELYSLNVQDGEILQMTSLKYGGHDFSIEGDYLYYTCTEYEGREVFRTPLKNLQPREANFSHRFVGKVANDIAGMQKTETSTAQVQISEPENYSKALHLLRFHSWLPIFFKYDGISSISMESIYQNAGLGATAFFQNDLGTASGFIGWHARPGNHSAHAQFTYTGWYPVIEASADFGGENSYLYSSRTTTDGLSLRGRKSSAPLIDASLKAYIPFNFSTGGWKRGVIPQLSFNINNGLYGRYAIDRTFITYAPMNRLSASLRAYTMMRTPASAIYPRFGIGAEVGYITRLNLSSVFCSTAYGHVYGYLPGILPTHGIKLSALGAFRATQGAFSQEAVNSVPRGFDSKASSIIGSYPIRGKLSLDYAFPFGSLDWSGLSPLAYIRNFEFTAHADFSFFGSRGAESFGNIFSVGADLALRLGNLLWVPYATRIGVSYNYNGGKSFGYVSTRSGADRHNFGLLFSVDF